MEIKKNISLIVGLCIPVLMILFVAGSIYLPGLFIHPKINFVYASGDDYYYYRDQQYFVEKGKLVKNEIKDSKESGRHATTEVKLFLYNVAENKNQEISFEEAQKLNLDSNSKSPDGFEIVYGNRDGGMFPFFFDSSSDYGNRYIKGHNVTRKLDIQSSGRSYYDYGFHFLGWIK